MKTYKSRSFYSYPSMTVAIVEVPREDDLPEVGEEIEIDGGAFKLRGFEQPAMMYDFDGSRKPIVHMIVQKIGAL